MPDVNNVNFKVRIPDPKYGPKKYVIQRKLSMREAIDIIKQKNLDEETMKAVLEKVARYPEGTYERFLSDLQMHISKIRAEEAPPVLIQDETPVETFRFSPLRQPIVSEMEIQDNDNDSMVEPEIKKEGVNE